MNFLGMGPMEILLVLLIAFIFLGPEKMMDAAKLLGKAVREGRRIMAELPKVVIEDDDIKILNIDSQRLTRNEPGFAPDIDDKRSDEPGDRVEAEDAEADDAPVTFRSGDQPPVDPPSETPAP
ncbi:MAG: twin-arginine translocase TatA/TatE family subunit [SAR202 cluster bacterium]|nr:twin-arginine translocase TatA/TatE family subunit [SAR202 cluster bacterium]HAL49157.1 hypothetical protein [Dehalococcoidia bacterium]MDP6663868.1 twin-arginine translocase TatA/TatE family subunit [SAR202 cluster bacterium]MDP6799643.1 twin-arginine translocase TatA/TatE family subunit [SAR202 cluster bacterium]MQG57636.1 twin-arginine translocase TatA/TatE family subunit [SAR202 cluster bacterium]